MADDVGGDEPETGDGSADEEPRKLNPEEDEAVRRMVENLRRKFLNLDLPSLKVPSETIRNMTAISGIAEAQQAMVRNALTPIRDAQASWQRQNRITNSDIFRSQALEQSNLDRIASQLTKNMDFGISESMAKVAKQFAEQQASMLAAIGPSLRAFKLAFYPPNLQTIEDLRFEQVEQVVMVDGIPLYGVPRTSTAQALIEADGASKRRDILGRRWKTISADCREAAENRTSSAISPYVPFALAALDALDAGHVAAAQALAGSLVDAILSSYFGKDRSKYTPHPQGKRTKDAYEEFNVREFVAFAPMWQAYQQFFVTNGDKVPNTFSRNATAHTVSPRQFNRRNAVQGLMFACSLMYRLDEEALAREAS
jgi:hypothetical protein